MIDRNSTPRPGGPLRRISSGAVLPSSAAAEAAAARESEPTREGKASLTGLATDMSVVLRERIEAGYGGDATTNAALSEGSVREFWLWVARTSLIASSPLLVRADLFLHRRRSSSLCRRLLRRLRLPLPRRPPNPPLFPQWHHQPLPAHSSLLFPLPLPAPLPLDHPPLNLQRHLAEPQAGRRSADEECGVRCGVRSAG